MLTRITYLIAAISLCAAWMGVFAGIVWGADQLGHAIRPWVGDRSGLYTLVLAGAMLWGVVRLSYRLFDMLERRSHIDHSACRNCRYSLTGLIDRSICPECGKDPVRSEEEIRSPKDIA